MVFSLDQIADVGVSLSITLRYSGVELIF